MQALSSTQNSSNGSLDDSNEHNSNGISESSPGETGTTPDSFCNHVENSTVGSQQNTIAINNNNCDTTKNNNQTVIATAPLEISTINDVEAIPAVAMIEQQNALLRGVNIGKRERLFHLTIFPTILIINLYCTHTYFNFSWSIRQEKAAAVHTKC